MVPCQTPKNCRTSSQKIGTENFTWAVHGILGICGPFCGMRCRLENPHDKMVGKASDHLIVKLAAQAGKVFFVVASRVSETMRFLG